MLSKNLRSVIGVLALGILLAWPAAARPARPDVAEWRKVLYQLSRLSFYDLVLKTAQLLAPDDPDEEGGYVDPDGKA